MPLKANWAFDQRLYQELNAAREQVVKNVLSDLRAPLELKTAVDVGCGLGHFSNFLHSLGFQVLGVDARRENVEEAQKRYPELRFQVANAEDLAVNKLGTFDLVLCLGLLYHLENPFHVIRQLAGMTAKLALVEGVCYPSSEPAMVLLNENTIEDQGVNYLAFYPSESCLLKMLYRSGFSACFFPSPMPAHPFYEANKSGYRYRTMMAAAKVNLSSPALSTVAEPKTDLTPWNLKPLRALGFRSNRIYNFFQSLLGRHGS
jgi:SAM-dependent methyltransferase